MSLDDAKFTANLSGVSCILLEFNGECKPHNKPLKKGLSHNDKNVLKIQKM